MVHHTLLFYSSSPLQGIVIHLRLALRLPLGWLYRACHSGSAPSRSQPPLNARSHHLLYLIRHIRLHSTYVVVHIRWSASTGTSRTTHDEIDCSGAVCMGIFSSILLITRACSIRVLHTWFLQYTIKRYHFSCSSFNMSPLGGVVEGLQIDSHPRVCNMMEIINSDPKSHRIC